jgi:hypothetical protein
MDCINPTQYGNDNEFSKYSNERCYCSSGDTFNFIAAVNRVCRRGGKKSSDHGDS